MKRPEGSRLARCPWGLFGWAGIVLVVESLHVMSPLPAATSGDDWRLGGEAAIHRAAGRDDVLYLGDSTIKLGVVPRVIEARTGLRGHNLAITAAQAPMTYFQLRRALEAGARPAAIVVDYTPVFLNRAQAVNTHCGQYFSLREALELAWSLRDGSLFAYMALARSLPVVRDREGVRGEIFHALMGKTAEHHRYFNQQRRNMEVNDGALIFPNFSVLADPVAEYAEKFPGPWWNQPVHATYMRRLFQLAETHGIRVYWLLTPMEPRMRRLCEQGGQDAAFTRFVRAVSAGRKNVVVLDARRAGEGLPIFTDGLHLNRGGAVALSTALADVLAERRSLDPHSSAAKWVELPRLREQPQSGLLEDLEQSMFAVRRQSTIR
jgi:hypothetical protein